MYAPPVVDPQGIADELFALRPGARVVGGAVIAGLGVAVDVLLWDAGWIWGLGLFAVLIGVLAIGSGIMGFRHERRMRADVARALGQWEELRREVEQARRTREGTGKALTRLGYRDHEVRSWIRQRLEEESGAANSAGDGGDG